MELCGVSDTVPRDGRSLLPLLRHPHLPDDRVVYAEAGTYRPFMSYPTAARGEASRPRALIAGGYKLLVQPGREDELYDLGRDPTEQYNLVPTEPGRTADMRALLQFYAAGGGLGPEPAATGAHADRLRSLGYLQ